MRRRRRHADGTVDGAVDESHQAPEPAEAVPGQAPGPRDFADMDPEETYVHLGSLLIPPPEGLELRLQVDEQASAVAAVLLVGEEGLLEVRAFAASRGGDLWTDARREIAADTARRGGTASEQEGPFGTELLCQVPVTGPNGESLVQPSRVLGHNGNRWFLRGTLAGRPAMDPEAARPFEEIFARVVVDRGSEAMPPGEALPLRLPPEAQRLSDPGPDDARPHDAGDN